jgi:hypothetical protein
MLLISRFLALFFDDDLLILS